MDCDRRDHGVVLDVVLAVASLLRRVDEAMRERAREDSRGLVCERSDFDPSNHGWLCCLIAADQLGECWCRDEHLRTVGDALLADEGLPQRDRNGCVWSVRAL